MTTLATRTRELGELEGFDIEVIDSNGKPADLKKNDLLKYAYEKKARGSTTVAEWIEK